MQELFPPSFRRLSLSTGAWLGLSFLAYLITARLYAPEDFGWRAGFLGLAQLLMQVAVLGYDMAIPTAVSQRKAIQLMWAILPLPLVLGLIVLGVFLVLQYGGFLPPQIPHYAWFMWGIVWLGGLGKIYMNWAIRKNEISAFAQSKVWQGVTKSGIEVLLGLIHPFTVSLIAALLAGQAALLIPFRSRWWRVKRLRSIMKFPTSVKSGKVLWAYRSFPFFSLPALLLNTFMAYFPAFYLIGFRGPEEAGFFSLSWTVISLATTLAADSYGAYFLAELSGNKNGREGLRRLISRGMLFTLVVTVVLFLGSLFLAEPVLTFFVGSKWGPAFQLLPALSLVFPAYLLHAMSFHLLHQFRHNRLILLFQAGKTAALLLLLLVPWLITSVEVFCWIYAGLMNIGVALQWFGMWRRLRTEEIFEKKINFP